MEKKFSQLNVICLESDAFYALIDHVVDHVKKENSLPKEDDWIDKEEAMKLLRIKSETTLQKYRDEFRIEYNPINRRTFVYSRSSIKKYLNKNIKKAF